MVLKEVPAWRRWLGRSRRLEFWVCVVALYAARAGLYFTVAHRQPGIVDLVALPFWLIIATRRLNDLGVRWWPAWASEGVSLTGVLFARLASYGDPDIGVEAFYLFLFLSLGATLAVVIYLGFRARPPELSQSKLEVTVFD